jgi:hypothetical protein
VTITQAESPTVTVHLRGLPVRLAAKAGERSQDLLREFAMITADVVDCAQPAAGHEVPMRLMHLVVSLTQQLFGLTEEPDRQLAGAIAGGAAAIDQELEWPRDVAAATRAIADLWDEADQYCWRHDHLTDLATPADCAAYRRWVFAQVLDQLEGRGPVPWPDSAAARGL